MQYILRNQNNIGNNRITQQHSPQEPMDNKYTYRILLINSNTHFSETENDKFVPFEQNYNFEQHNNKNVHQIH